MPGLARSEKAEPYLEEIQQHYAGCKGNLMRVHEELVASGAELSYQALTAFCRRRGIGTEPPKAAGRYHFEPGQEMQHDTSPHTLHLDGKLRRAQTASLVLCYSRMLFFQFYPNFRRFDCKVFLTEALRSIGGACSSCMIDNTGVVVLHGTGREMVPVPEMEAFADRYSFRFAAHEKGDANRSARVERPFSYIEGNFLAGRRFRDWEDANTQARQWCDKVNATHKRHLKASPRELYLTERPRLKPLPAWVPEVYLLHHRIVDVERYVNVNTNRYSVPVELIGRRLEVRETSQWIEVFDGPRRVTRHRRIVAPENRRSTLPEHLLRRSRRKPSESPTEEKRLLGIVPELGDYVRELRLRNRGRATLALRRLLKMCRDYPRKPLLEAVRTASHYGLYDLERLERMVLKRVVTHYFELPYTTDEDDDE